MSNLKKSKSSLVNKIDKKLKEIDPKYNPDKLKEIDFDNKKNYSVDDLIKIIDKKLKK